MKRVISGVIVVVVCILGGCMTTDPVIDIAGQWCAYDTYKLDNDGDTDDILFNFTEGGRYHSKFYDDLDTETGLILEAKGTYMITDGSDFNWHRTHLWNGSEWIESEDSGVFALSLEGDSLRMESGSIIWVLRRI